MISRWQTSYSRRSCSNILRRSRTSSSDHAPQDLALLGIDQLGDGLVGRFAQHFARFQAAAGAGDDLIAAHKRIATAGREDAEVAHHSVADDVFGHLEQMIGRRVIFALAEYTAFNERNTEKR